MINQISKLEALLFIYGEPMPYKKISKILDLKPEELKNLVSELEKELKNRNGGLALVSDEEKVQLVTKPEFSKLLEEVVKEEFHEELSPASLEALSIIAYASPISRAELEYIRGVNSSFTLRSLLLRGLIERSPDPKRPNAFTYSPSFELLKYLGIAKRENLPEFEKFQKLIGLMRVPLPPNEQSQP
jgi:segregation and condensation protein B